MQFASNARSLLFTRSDQPAAEFHHRSPRVLLIGDIDTAAYVSGKRAGGVESRRADVQDPPVFSVVATKPVLHPEFLMAIKTSSVHVQAPLQIFFVHPISPAVAKFLIEASAGELKPRLIEIVA